jgi:tRNA(Arg) A34 adenosine deaminase TadA
VRLEHPGWLDPAALTAVDPDDPAAAMALAVALARANVEHGTGGPFGAVITAGGGEIVGAGVNVVVAQRSSIAHAEVMALLDAQARAGRPRLNGVAGGPFTLATSAQPCVMCFGAVFWAGLDALLVGARAADVEALAGFDEGPVPADWAAELAVRGILVTVDVLREQACAVLRDYAVHDGARY